MKVIPESFTNFMRECPSDTFNPLQLLSCVFSDDDSEPEKNHFTQSKINGLSVSGQKAYLNLQIEIEFKPEVKNYKL